MVIKRYSMLLLFVFSVASIFGVAPIYGQSDSQTESFDFRNEFEGYLEKNKNFLSKSSGYYKSQIQESSSRFDNIKLINKTDFPKLYAMINRLANKISIKMPAYLAISFDEDNGSRAYVASVETSTQERGELLVAGKYLFCNCSDAEIEAVMAHELAHIALGHSNESFAINKASVPIAGLTGVAAFFIACCGGDSIARSSVGALSVAVASYYGIKFLNGSFFSRAREKEADLTAVRKLGAGKGLIRFFLRDKREPSWLEQLFSTHPSDEERIQYIQAAMVNMR